MQRENSPPDQRMVSTADSKRNPNEDFRQFDFTMSKYVKVHFKNELEQLSQLEKAKNHLVEAKNDYKQLLNEITIQNSEKEKVLEENKIEHQLLLNSHYDQYDKSNPLQIINANNNFRVYVNQHREEPELRQWLEQKKKELLETEMKLFEANQFQGTLKLMHRRLKNQQEDIRKKVVELDELTELINKRNEEIYQKTNILLTEKVLIKFTFQNVLHVVDKLGKIQSKIRKQKLNYGKIQEKDMYQELISYSKYREQYDHDYQVLQEQLDILKDLNQLNEEKVNKQKEGNYLVGYLDDFDTIFEVFVKQPLNNIDKGPFLSAEKSRTNTDNKNNSIQESHTLTEGGPQQSETRESVMYTIPRGKLTISLPKKTLTQQYSPIKRKSSNVDLANLRRGSIKYNTVQNKPVSSSKKSTAPNTQRKKSKTQQHFLFDSTLKKNKDLHSSWLSTHSEQDEDGSDVEKEDLEEKMNRILNEKQQNRQNIVEQLNQFYSKHNNDIKNLFDKFNHIFRYFSHQIDTCRDQIFQLEFEKQKNNTLLEKLNQEVEDYIKFEKKEKEALNPTELELIPENTTNNMIFETQIKETNIIEFKETLLFKDEKESKKILIFLVISLQDILWKFNNTLKSIIQIADNNVIIQQLAKLIGNTYNYLSLQYFNESKFTQRNDEKFLFQELREEKLSHIDHIIQSGTNYETLRDSQNTVILENIFQQLFPTLSQSLLLFKAFINDDIVISKFSSYKNVLFYLNQVKNEFNTQKEDFSNIEDMFLQQILYENIHVLSDRAFKRVKRNSLTLVKQIHFYLTELFSLKNDLYSDLKPFMQNYLDLNTHLKEQQINMVQIKSKQFQGIVNRKFHQNRERNGIWEEDKYASLQCVDMYTDIPKKQIERPNLLNVIKMEVENINRGEGPNNMMDEVTYVEKQRKQLRAKFDQQSKSAEHSNRQKNLENNKESNENEEDESQQQQQFQVQKINLNQHNKSIQQSGPFCKIKKASNQVINNNNSQVQNQNTSVQLTGQSQNQSEGVKTIPFNMKKQQQLQQAQSSSPKDKTQQQLQQQQQQQQQQNIMNSRFMQTTKSKQQDWEHWNKITHYDKMFRQVKKQALKDIQNPNKQQNYDINQIQVFDKGRKKKNFLTLMKNKKREKDQVIYDQQQRILEQLYQASGIEEENKEQIQDLLDNKTTKKKNEKKGKSTQQQQQSKTVQRKSVLAANQKHLLDSSPLNTKALKNLHFQNDEKDQMNSQPFKIEQTLANFNQTYNNFNYEGMLAQKKSTDISNTQRPSILVSQRNSQKFQQQQLSPLQQSYQSLVPQQRGSLLGFEPSSPSLQKQLSYKLPTIQDNIHNVDIKSLTGQNFNKQKSLSPVHKPIQSQPKKRIQSKSPVKKKKK